MPDGRPLRQVLRMLAAVLLGVAAARSGASGPAHQQVDVGLPRDGGPAALLPKPRPRSPVRRRHVRGHQTLRSVSRWRGQYQPRWPGPTLDHRVDSPTL